MAYVSLPLESSDIERSRHYEEVLARIEALLAEEDDWIAAMATVACELHHSFDYYDWTGFYRVVAPNLLKVGPYQGGHGCLVIPFDKGVCGAAARSLKTQLVENVNAVADHIACSASTNSEIVVPVLNRENVLLAVLDVDSDAMAAFRSVDQIYLERLCQYLGQKAYVR